MRLSFFPHRPDGWLTSLVLIALFAAAGLTTQPLAAAELAISTDFPGGSAVLRELDPASGRIAIEPSAHPDHGWPCWWYFRVDGARPGQQLTLEVAASGQPFRPGKRLAAAWALPHQPSISGDDAHWQLGQPGTPIKEGRSYSIVAPSERFWLAWGPPFLPAHGEALITETTEKLPAAQRFVLAQTRQGRPVPAIRIAGPTTVDTAGDGGAADATGAIWVQARQHAWETGSSWVGQGFLRWIASDDAEAIWLRDTHEIFFVPIMDVDNVTLGAGGKEAVPRDHNRDWSDQPVYPEVAAAQAHIRELADSDRLRVFLDLHNPGAGDKQPFFFGPLDYDQMPAPHRQLYDRFLELATEHIRGPLAIHPRYRFATYVTTEEERARVSGNWVRNYAGENVIAMTLETAWDTPHSTTDGYQGVGRGLAKTIANFLREQLAE
jgi:hypothetical protein